MKNKTCNTCNIEQPIDNFYKGANYKDGHINKCKDCEKIYRKNRSEKANEITKQWYLKNKEKQKEYKKKYYINNKDKFLSYQKQYRIKNNEKIRKYSREYQKQRLLEDIQYKLSKNLRSRLNKALNNDYKTGSAVDDLGCSIEELRKHLESKFQDGMSWDNIGEWHIDHIEPLASFNLTNRDELLKACQYTNLQPLWAEDNWKKG